MKQALQLAFAAIILAVIVFGFYLTGSPSENRILRQDEVRVSDLRNLRNAINQYQRQEKKAPSLLQEVFQNCAGKTGYQCSRLDGINAEDFEYSVRSEKTFELCTTFERAAPFPRGGERKATNPSQHEAGRHCYSYDFPRPKGSAFSSSTSSGG